MSDKATMIKTKILNEIEKEMKRLGMSQGELGRRMGVERYNINRYLRSYKTPVSFDRIFEMAETVGLDINVTVKRKLKKKD
ncbi:MAG: helix-turn-helix transcriptional regulator [Bdellovibrionota bacterium]